MVLIQNPERFLNPLQDESKITRRNAIKNLYEEVQKYKNNDLFHKSEFGDDGANCSQTEILIQPLISLLKDPVERTREISYELLIIFLQRLKISNLISYLPKVIPCILERLGQQEINEPSEEVRMCGVRLLELLVQILSNKLSPYIDDLLQILASTITDPYHAVRILSCKVAIEIATSCRNVFHYNSDRLLKPLCISMVHQQYRVRLASVECLKVVILIGNHKAMEGIIPYVTQRLFDSSPVVRKAVLITVGDWMLDYIDRYSYFHKLLPLILTGLGDESDELVDLSTDLWEAIGAKYLEENLEEYREQADFQFPDPSHYPKSIKRPSLGCRILAWRCTCNILSGIANELSDWSVNTRSKSAQLLYHLILNCEDKITIHVEKIFQFLYKAVLDEEANVAKYVWKSAELLGYFIPLSVSWPILCSAISNGPTEGNLGILAAVLTGTEPSLLFEHVDQILNIFCEKEICQVLSSRKQELILRICQVIIKLSPTKNESVKISQIFYIIFNVHALSNGCKKVEDFAKVLLSSLVDAAKHKSLDELLGTYSTPILNEMRYKSGEWTAATPERLIFDLILSYGGLAVDNNMDIILEIMTCNLGPEKDPEVRLKFFTMLSGHLVSYKNSSTSQKKNLQLFIKHIIEDVLDPNLIWRAGKSAGVLRTAASSCLHSILDGHIIEAESLIPIAPKLISSLIGISDDSSEITRYLVTKCLKNLIINSNKGLDPELLNKIYPVMLKRLDDVSSNVRTGALETLTTVFNNLPESYDIHLFKPCILHAYTTLLVHLDDADEDIQEKVYETLENIGHLLREDLIKECEKVRENHRSPSLCNSLIDKFSTLSAN